jgi:hypothetical protein
MTTHASSYAGQVWTESVLLEVYEFQQPCGRWIQTYRTLWDNHIDLVLLGPARQLELLAVKALVDQLRSRPGQTYLQPKSRALLDSLIIRRPREQCFSRIHELLVQCSKLFTRSP